MIDLVPVKGISIFDVLENLAVHVPTNVMSRRHPQIKCPLPDHDERGASFTIYPENNSWWCFGCASGNDVIDLVQQMTGLEWRASVEQLAEWAGQELAQGGPYEREQTPEDLLPLVADQAHADVTAWTKRPGRVLTVEAIVHVFADYDEAQRAHRAGEIDAQEAIKRLLAWRSHWKAVLT
jgi:hypothetical protein